MTYAIIGTGDYSWMGPGRVAALGNGASFGEEGTVRILGLRRLWQTSNVTTAAYHLNNAAEKPDIVLYFAYGAAPNTAVSHALADYIKKGGVVIYGASDNTEEAVNTLMEGVFGAEWREADRVSNFTSSNTAVFQLNNLPNCPIVNGPFGNLSSGFWGEDNDGSIMLKRLPPNSVQIASATSTSVFRNPEFSMIWYNESFNFVYFGDCVASSTSSTSQTGWPALYTTTGLPLTKLYGPSTVANRRWVSNAVLELNAVAWGLRKAAVSGINPH